ncbi:hypothetical protein STEG23_030004, partial [Scotinomys teguina]
FPKATWFCMLMDRGYSLEKGLPARKTNDRAGTFSSFPRPLKEDGIKVELSTNGQECPPPYQHTEISMDTQKDRT